MLSLRHLGLERIELYQLHRIDPKVPLADQLGELRALQDEGKIHHIGLSEVSVEELQAAQKIADDRLGPEPLQPRQPRVGGAARPLREHGIGFIPWFPLATGGLAESLAARSTLIAKSSAPRRRSSRSRGCSSARR